MTIVVVTGSRKLAEHEHRLAIKSWFLEFIIDLFPTQVHHGGAAGPDTWAAGAFPTIAKMHRPSNCCPTCGGTGKEDMSWLSPKDYIGMPDERAKPGPCPDCVDGKTDRTPAQALFDRNQTMIDAAIADAADSLPLIMVACWDGQSKGTGHAIDYAAAWKIPIIHVPVDLIVAAERCRNYTEQL